MSPIMQCTVSAQCTLGGGIGPIPPLHPLEETEPNREKHSGFVGFTESGILSPVSVFGANPKPFIEQPPKGALEINAMVT